MKALVAAQGCIVASCHSGLEDGNILLQSITVHMCLRNIVVMSSKKNKAL